MAAPFNSGNALSEFLRGIPDRTDEPDPIDKLGKALHVAGPKGLQLAEAMEAAGLSRSDLYNALGLGTKIGLLEVEQVGDQTVVRLSKSGESLY